MGIRWERLACASKTEGAIEGKTPTHPKTNVKGWNWFPPESFFNEVGLISHDAGRQADAANPTY